jgi:glutamate synthase domain-containing protein 1
VCGVIGLLIRDPELESQLGTLLVPMVAALDERGPDSAGIAVYSDSSPTAVQLSIGSDEPVDWAEVRDGLRAGGAGASVFGPGLLVDVPGPEVGAVRTLLATRWPEVRVLGAGRSLRVLKDTGRPSDICSRYGVAGWPGYMAVAHTRMATESAVTMLHSHPFVPDVDLAVVHNGSFSNHASVRRRLEAEGAVFDSDNDSEVAARLIARGLTRGDSLDGATRRVMEEMDGFFTMVIATASEMSVVRDAFACKPAVVAETDSYVAVASEYRALAELPRIAEARIFEPRPEEVYTWSR